MPLNQGQLRCALFGIQTLMIRIKGVEDVTEEHGFRARSIGGWLVYLPSFFTREPWHFDDASHSYHHAISHGAWTGDGCYKMMTVVVIIIIIINRRQQRQRSDEDNDNIDDHVGGIPTTCFREQNMFRLQWSRTFWSVTCVVTDSATQKDNQASNTARIEPNDERGTVWDALGVTVENEDAEEHEFSRMRSMGASWWMSTPSIAQWVFFHRLVPPKPLP
ncbi:hypothetical protein EDB83DRAFT_2320205 [Lactarius deliciosus]|nr:hypothetical protein EDB83DRAFT_2320205 [Lactarius deliciosus]